MKLRRLIFLILIGYITPLAIVAAYKAREYFTFGGEWLIPFYYFILKRIGETFIDMAKDSYKLECETDGD